MSSRNSRRRSRHPQPVNTPSALTSSAVIVNDQDDLTKNLVIQPNEPQAEAWQFYRSLGELSFGVGTWLANSVSRVRLVAAEMVTGGDEPIPITEGPVADLVQSLMGGISGQAAMMKKAAVHLSVPGEMYLVGEDDAGVGDPATFTWHIYSSSELQIAKRNPMTYRVQEYQGVWRTLKGEFLVARIWSPDDEIGWRPWSPVQAALPILREVDYWNRYIIAILLSRLAMNGVWLIPQEASFPVDPRFKDAADPFVAKLIDTASKAIKNPGSAAAAIPIPLRVPKDLIDSFKHLTFNTKIDERLEEHRQAALTRLATALNMPGEVLTGMSKMNHWGQWQLEESAIKTYISPIVEIICHGLTLGYLKPMAKAANVELKGPNGGQIVMWYDTTELTQQPDRGGDARETYDRGELNSKALVRESGLDENDIPKDEEFKNIALKKIAMGGGADALRALSLLLNDESLLPPPPAPVAPPGEPASPPQDGQNPPSDSQPTDKSVPNTRPGSQPPPPPPKASVNPEDWLVLTEH